VIEIPDGERGRILACDIFLRSLETSVFLAYLQSSNGQALSPHCLPLFNPQEEEG